MDNLNLIALMDLTSEKNFQFRSYLYEHVHLEESFDFGTNLLWWSVHHQDVCAYIGNTQFWVPRKGKIDYHS